MDATAKIKGLDSALEALRHAFPQQAEPRRKLINQSMRHAAKNTIVASAKRRALRAGKSGALSESIGMRTLSRRQAIRKGSAATIQVLPLRSNKKAMQMYIDYYYNRKGKAAPLNMIASGIRHGHLVEFGSKNNAARPFLWPAAMSQKKSYSRQFAKFLKFKVERAVRLRARKAKRGKK